MKNRILAALAAGFLLLQPCALAANILGKDGTGATKNWKADGDGSSGNPYIQHQIPTDGTNTASFQSSGSDASSNVASHLAVSAWLQGYNGSTWDRLRVGLFSPTSSVTGYLNTLPFGRYNATPPTLTDGQFVALQLNSAGALKVDPSGATQPVSGTLAATQSGMWNVGLSSGSNTIGKVDQGVGGVSAWKVDGSGVIQPVSGTFWQTTQPVSGTFWQSIQPISAASLPLPSGAATAAKQPALGTAGTASSDVLSVQGIASMIALKTDGSGFTQPVSGTVTVQQSTASSLKVDLSGTAANATALKVDGSAVTQPVSGTVTANAGTGTFGVSGTVTANIGTSGSLALDATLTGGSQKAIMRGGTKGTTSAADVTSTASGSNHQPVDVAIYDGSGNQITSFGGGTQYADGGTQATPTGTVALGKNGSNVLHSLSLDGSGNLNVNVASGGGSGGTSSSFGSPFPSTGTAIGASDGTNMQGLLVDGSGNLLVKINAGGATQPVSASSLPLPTGAATSAKQAALGTAGTASSDVLTVQGIASMTPLKTDGSGTTQPISGTVTVQQSTASNLKVDLSGTAANATAIKVDGSAVTQPVSGTVTASLSSSTNAGATVKTSDYDTGAGTDTVTSFGIALPASGGAVQGGTATNPIRIDPTGTTTQPVSGTVTANAGSGTFTVSGTVTANQGGSNWSQNQTQWNGTAVDTNSGVKSAGTLRVVLATDQPALTNKLLVTPDANSAFNVAQINGVTPLMGNGTTGTGSQRVTIASDNTAFSVNAVQSGTWTVQPGNTANTTPWLVAQQATTAGGVSLSKVISAATTNATSVKASAGQVYFITASNINASARYLKLYNKASSPTVGTDTPVLTFLIPGNTAGAGTNIPIPDCGLAFGTGIALAITTGVADNDSGAVAASEIVVNIGYK